MSLPYPYNGPLPAHLKSQEDGISLLKAFDARHPNLAPWAISAAGPSIYFNSHSALELRDALGEEGWTVEKHLIWKEYMGIRVECRLPIASIPFSWEGAQ